MEHGPFPIRLWRLLGGIASAATSALFVWVLLTPTVLVCGSRGGECRVDRPLGAAPHRFARASLRRVRVDEVTGSKNRTYGVPVLELSAGEVRLEQVAPERAAEFATRVNRAITGPAAFEAELRDSLWMGLLALLLLVFGAGLVVTALRGLGRYRLSLDVGHRRLEVERRVFGVRVSSSSVSVDGVIDVELEWTLHKDFFTVRQSQGETRARLLLVTASGERRPVTARSHPGYTLHLVAESRLRELLGCRARDPARALELETIAAGHHPPASWVAGPAGRFAAVWIGVCCGCLAGLATYALVGLSLGLLRLTDDLDGAALTMGAGGGALAGAALALYAARARPPR